MSKFVILWTVCAFSSAAFDIVKDGKAQSAIVLDEKPNTASQLGALELQHYVRLITGAELPVVNGKNTTKFPNAIRITSDCGRDTGEFYSLTAKDHEIILTGHDTPDFRTVDYNDVKTFPDFEQRYNGSLFAVYDFLENYCTVHFYTPGELGTTFRKTPTLSVNVRNKEFVPPLDAFRYIHIDDKPLYTKRFSPRDLALWRLRWRQTSFFGRTNHNQYSIYFAHWDKASRPGFGRAFKEKRPELFAKGYTGKNAGVDPILRSNYPNDKDIPPQLCYSEPETVKYYANEVMTYYKGGNAIGGWYNFSAKHDPSEKLMQRFKGKMFFYPIQGGDTGGYCLCEKCKSRFPEDSEENISNNKFQFIADVAEAVRTQVPDAGVSTLAYISTLNPPSKVKLPDNVSVQVCLTNYAWWHPVAYKLQHGAYEEWIKEAKKRPITLWTYIFGSHWDASHHFGNYRPFPTFYPWVIGKQMKEFTADGIRGYFTEVELQYNMLEAYMAARLAFDPTADQEKIIDEYFREYYGKAAVPMKEFYREIEGSFFNTANAPAEWLRDPNKFIGPKGLKHPNWGTGLLSPQINWGKAGTPERMAKLTKLLAEAESLEKSPEVQARFKDFRETLWNDVLQGEKEWRTLQKRMSAPPKLLSFSKLPDAAGNLEKIDWSKAAKTDSWSSLNGEEIDGSHTVHAATDGKYLYLKYTDSLKPYPERDIWRENIELFFSNDGKHYVYQLAVAPGGTVSAYRYDHGKQQTADLKATVKNLPKADSWEVQIALPLDSIEFKNWESLSMNFFRTRREGTAVWSPIFCSAYLDGIPNFGRAAFFPQTITAEKFTCHDKGNASNIVDDPAAKNQKAGMMKTDYGWSLQCRVPGNFSSRYSYKVTVRIRSEIANPDDSLKCKLGFYDSKARKIVGIHNIPFTRIQRKEYREIELGNYQLSPDMFLYISGVEPKNPENKVFLESVRFDLAK